MEAAMHGCGQRCRHSCLLILLLMSQFSPISFLSRRAAHHASSGYAEAFNLQQDITLQRCRYPYNKTKDFYRINFHERMNKKHVPSLPRKQDDANNSDVVYTTTRQGEVVAALRLTKSKNDEEYTFLRSMCVSREYRRHGFATQLLRESLWKFNAHHCYCFASPELETFYQKLGFTAATAAGPATITTPRWMINSFESIANRNRHKKLKLFIKHHSSSSSATTSTNNNATEVVLLQHISEESKKTATGWLLNDTQYSQHFGDIQMNYLVQSDMKLTIWTWRGTNDIAMVEEQIMRLKENKRTVYLLWTGGVSTNEKETTKETSAETYIIIDGTWQQAKKIYRKVPILWSLPRLSLDMTSTNIPPSKYILRGDYSDWRKRFSNNHYGDGSELLCTAECAAAVMDQCGNAYCANEIRSRLDAFQSTFPEKIGD